MESFFSFAIVEQVQRQVLQEDGEEQQQATYLDCSTTSFVQELELLLQRADAWNGSSHIRHNDL